MNLVRKIGQGESKVSVPHLSGLRLFGKNNDVLVVSCDRETQFSDAQLKVIKNGMLTMDKLTVKVVLTFLFRLYGPVWAGKLPDWGNAKTGQMFGMRGGIIRDFAENSYYMSATLKPNARHICAQTH